jgi:hypothetical protein
MKFTTENLINNKLLILLLCMTSLASTAMEKVSQSFEQEFVIGTRTIAVNIVRLEGKTSLTATLIEANGLETMSIVKIIPALCSSIWLHEKADLIVCETDKKQYFQSIEKLIAVKQNKQEKTT